MHVDGIVGDLDRSQTPQGINPHVIEEQKAAAAADRLHGPTAGSTAITTAGPTAALRHRRRHRQPHHANPHVNAPIGAIAKTQTPGAHSYSIEIWCARRGPALRSVPGLAFGRYACAVADGGHPGGVSTSSYVLSRLREDSRHTVALAEVDGQIGHPGVKGRFRELLLNNLLLPWLPSAVGCGTGVIVDHKQAVVDAGQDDIVLFDQLLAPSILASSNSTHGVYFFDNVLCRVEVKSTLTKADLTGFTKASKAISTLQLAAGPGQQPEVFGAFNMLASFDTAIASGKELEYLECAMKAESLDPCGGVVSGMCIARRGFWLLGKEGEQLAWKKLRAETDEDHLAYFVGVVSNSCFDQRAARQGLTPVGGGIGLYLEHPFDVVSPCA